MGERSEFVIEKKSPQELVREMEMYPLLRRMAFSENVPDEELERRKNVLEEAILSTRVAMLYAYFREGMLESALTSAGVGKWTMQETELPWVVDFGSELEHLRSKSKLCGQLANLDTDRISASETLADLYHIMRVRVDETSGRSVRKSFLYDYEFWDSFFRFYELYNAE